MHMYRGWSPMRLLERDKRDFWYSQYTGRTMILDSNGNPTGEYTGEYAEPQKARGTFSLPTGAATPREFGNYIDYDFVVHMDEKPCPFDENAAIWYRKNPTTDDPNFRAVRIAETPTYTLVALREIR